MAASNGGCFSSSKGPYLSLLTEPVNKIRFRYKSEKGSHGVLIGKTGKKTFPTVKLENYRGKKAVVVKASLYTADRKTMHVLELMGKNCKRGICIQNLEPDHTAQFATLSILNKKKEEVIQTLMNKKLANHHATANEENNLEKKLKEEVLNELKEINLSSACLCFEAFYADDSQFQRPICEKLFTERIDNLKSAQLGDLRICRISKSSGSCAGGEDMILLCEKVKKEDIRIKFYEVDEADNIIWEDYGDFNKADVHYQVAIFFKTPKFKENVGKVVYIQLLRISNGDTSAGVKFEYIPHENDIDPVSRKRKKCNPPQESYNFPASTQPLLSAPSVNCTVFLSTNDQGSLPMDSQENETSSLSSADDVYSVDKLLNGGVEDLSANSFTSYDVSNPDFNLFNEDLTTCSSIPIPVDFEMEPYADDASSLFPALFSCNDFAFEAQGGCSQLVQTDGICKIVGEMADLRINTPKCLQRTDNNPKGIAGKEGCKKYIDILLKDPNVLHHYICGLIINHAGKGTRGSQQQRKIYVIQKLLTICKSIVNKENKFKETLLHVSTHHNSPDVLKILLKCGGNPNLRNKYGNNCLHIAAQNNSLEIMEILCSSLIGKFHPDLDILNYEGLAPLHIALENESKECISLLLGKGADINVKEGKSGRTILHLAVDSYPSLVPFILKQPGISIFAEDFGGITPLEVAIQNELWDIESQLLKAYEEHQDLKQDKVSLTGSVPLNVADEHSVSFLPLTNGSDASVDNDIVYDEVIDVYNRKNDNPFLSPSTEKKLCELLDPEDKWKILGFTMGLDESYLETIKILDSRTSPTRTLLNYFQRERKSVSRTVFLRELQDMLEVLGVKDDVILS